MCQFKSAIVTKKEVKYLLDEDSHTEILKYYNIKDDSQNPEFVRVEIVPKNNVPLKEVVYKLDLKHWEMRLDQDFKPDWWEASIKWAEEEMLKVLKETVKKRFVLKGQHVKKIKEGECWYLIDGVVDELYGKVNEMWGSSEVNVMRDSSEVNEMRGSSKVNEMHNNTLRISRKDNKLYLSPELEYKIAKHKNKYEV